MVIGKQRLFYSNDESSCNEFHVDFVAVYPKPCMDPTRGRDKLALGRAVQRAGQYRGWGGEVGRRG
jgi:hypothetical protein